MLPLLSLLLEISHVLCLPLCLYHQVSQQHPAALGHKKLSQRCALTWRGGRKEPLSAETAGILTLGVQELGKTKVLLCKVKSILQIVVCI